MKKVLIFILVLFLGCKESNKAPKVQGDKISEITLTEKKINNDYSGKWIYSEKDSNSDIPTLQFTLTIIQDEDNVNAQYCAIANSGGKIDCENKKEYNITGKIVNGKIIGSFYSFFGSSKDKGKFEISFIDNKTISWKITNTPKGIFYAPTKCNLKKEEELKAEKSNDNVFPIESGKTENLIWKENHNFSNYNNICILPKNEKISLVLAKNDMGDDEFYTLFTQNEKKQIIDSLKIGYVEDGYPENDKRIITEFIINPNYQIILNKFERKDYDKTFLNNLKYTISNAGKFVENTHSKDENK